MKVHQEILIFTLDSKNDISLCDFCDTHFDWAYSELKSKEYSKGVGDDGYIITLTEDEESYGFAIVRKNSKCFHLVNIFPSQSFMITTQKYNELAVLFGKAYRKYIRSINSYIKVKIPKPNLGIQDIIKSKLAREFLSKYLSQHPQSYHPLDIQRLDVFTCALARYSRSKIDFDLFQQYLESDLKWNKENASWCRNRIEIGWQVLHVNKTF